jgi:hypothetical protein
LVEAAAAHLTECGYAISRTSDAELVATRPANVEKQMTGVSIRLKVIDRGSRGFEVETLGETDTFYSIKDTTWNLDMANAAAEIDVQRAFIRTLTPPVRLAYPPDGKRRSS